MKRVRRHLARVTLEFPARVTFRVNPKVVKGRVNGWARLRRPGRLVADELRITEESSLSSAVLTRALKVGQSADR